MTGFTMRTASKSVAKSGQVNIVKLPTSWITVVAVGSAPPMSTNSIVTAPPSRDVIVNNGLVPFTRRM